MRYRRPAQMPPARAWEPAAGIDRHTPARTFDASLGEKGSGEKGSGTFSEKGLKRGQEPFLAKSGRPASKAVKGS